jgi:glutathionylspermidine synthase
MLVDHHDWVSKPLFGREGVGILDTLNSKFSNF